MTDLSLLRRSLAGLVALLGLLLIPALPAQALDESDLLPVEQAFILQAQAQDQDPDAARLSFTIADGYYLYRHRLAVQALDSGAEVGELILPEGELRQDEFFGEVETYRGQLQMQLPIIRRPASESLQLRVKYQGCADAGVCYPPQAREIRLSLPQSSAPSAPSPVAGLTLPAPPLPGSAGGGLPGLPGAPVGLGSQALPLPAEEAFRTEAIASSPTELLLRLTPAPGYYLYRDKIALQLRNAEGVQLASPAWPAGSTHEDPHFGKVAVFFDQIEVPVGLRRSRGEPGPITLQIELQGCQNDGICYPPMQRELHIDLPQASADQLVTLAPAPVAADPAVAAPAPSDKNASPSLMQLLGALLGAIGGGLILNLMPCVLPVLSLKVLGLAQSGESREKARRHALWYTAGVLSGFAALGLIVLGLRQVGLALGWGFQLQQPLLVAVLAYLMAAVGLSLSGVFTIGAGMAGVGQGLASRSGAAGDFFTGLLAVVVASPCTAPLMGPALAFAFTAHPALALTVFLALGLGLALPFLLVGFIPALGRLLPRPGAWMETLKQTLAFPMYLTAVWLLWVLGKQRGVDALAWGLIGIVLLAMALWRWEKARWGGGLAARALAVALTVLALWPLWQIPRTALPAAPTQNAPHQADWVPYSAQRLEALRNEGRTVFVNMTADWCVTCKGNEKRLLDTEPFRASLRAHDAIYMKGDWTDVNAEIASFLESHGAVGVPLYVVIRPGRPDTVLSTLPTLEAVESALSAP